MTDAEFAKNLPSPCVGICEMNDETGLCRGCYRTLEEIGSWRVMSGEDKMSLLQTLKQRRVADGGAVRERVTRRRADAWAARWTPKSDTPKSETS